MSQPDGNAKATKVCPVCETEFVPRRAGMIYCSAGCRWKAWDRSHPRVKESKPDA